MLSLCTGRHFYLWEMTQQLGKSSKSIRFAYLHFLQHRLLPTRSLHLCPQSQSACKKQGHRSGELLAILPVAGKLFGFSKRQEALQKEEESRKKAEGKRQETQMQIFSLSISPPPHPRLNRSLSASSHLLRSDRGFLIREEIGAASSKQKKTNAKKLYWGIGCGVFVCTVICQLQTDSRQLATGAGVGKKFEKIPAHG
ncbi:hypothetical protein [Microcoleus sp. herbarium19]